jgi:hypothetical protein
MGVGSARACDELAAPYRSAARIPLFGNVRINGAPSRLLPFTAYPRVNESKPASSGGARGAKTSCCD